MTVLSKVFMALAGVGLGCGAVLWLRSEAARQIKHLGLYLELAVFVLAISVVVDASFRRIGPDGPGDSPIFWAFVGGLIGALGCGLVLFIYKILKKRQDGPDSSPR